MRFVINMYPLNTATFSFRYRSPDKLSTDAMSLELWMHGRVQNERMIAAIPRQIDETYQSLFAEAQTNARLRFSTGVKSRHACPCQATANSAFSSSFVSAGLTR